MWVVFCADTPLSQIRRSSPVKVRLSFTKSTAIWRAFKSAIWFRRFLMFRVNMSKLCTTRR